MKLLIVHIGDIHVRTASDPVLAYPEVIAESIKDIDGSIDAVFVCVTGDLTWEGLEDQYYHSWSFLSALQDSLGKSISFSPSFGSPVHLVVVPGNHDCDFQQNSPARDVLLDYLQREKPSVLDDSVAEVLLRPQSAFFDFRDSFTPDNLVSSSQGSSLSRLFWQHRFVFGEEAIRFCCINSAFCSSIHERQGSLLFPVSLLPSANGLDFDESMVVTMQHHSLIRFEADNSRELKNAITGFSDVSLVGHEHASSYSRTEDRFGGRQIFVDGAALQSSVRGTSFKSSFNLLLLDTSEHREKFAQLTFSEGRYMVENAGIYRGEDGLGLRWRPYSFSRRNSKYYRLSESMMTFLDDPGLDLKKANARRLSLSEVYVYPSLLEHHYDNTTIRNTIGANQLIDSWGSSTTKVIVTGDSVSGKTALAKMLFKAAHRKGYLPVFLSGSERMPSDDRIIGYLEKKYLEQYLDIAPGDCRKTEKSKRFVILDDCDRLCLSEPKHKRIIQRLEEYSQNVLLVAGTLSMEFDDLVNPRGGKLSTRYQHFNIQVFNLVLRNRLIEKWLQMDSAQYDAQKLATELRSINRIIDVLFGKNFVPAYPFYLLSLLQAREDGGAIDTRASTNGYYYELFIKSALAVGRKKAEYDIMVTYLAEMAYFMYGRKQRSIGKREYEVFHEEYIEKTDLRISKEKYLEILMDKNILKVEEGEYRFKYEYQYYYFVARKLADDIRSEETRRIVHQLASAIYVEENSDILLFLAHLSNEEFIVDEMLSAGNGCFRENREATLEDDVAFLNQIDPRIAEYALEEMDAKEAREEHLATKDAEKERREQKDDIVSALVEKGDRNNPLVLLAEGMRTLQLIGQIMKNFPGKLSAERKLQVGRTAYNLGLRILGYLIELFERNKKELLTESMDMIINAHPRTQKDRLKRQAVEWYVGMARLVCYSMIKNTANAVGLSELEITYRKLLEQAPNVSVELINQAIEIDHITGLKTARIVELAEKYTDNPTALSVLQGMVLNYVILMPGDYRNKMQICDKLGIKYSRMRLREVSTKKLVEKIEE